MTKLNGKYYLQYAAPGTEYKSYCDGVYVSDKPLGPFKLALIIPFPTNPKVLLPEPDIVVLFRTSTATTGIFRP